MSGNADTFDMGGKKTASGYQMNTNIQKPKLEPSKAYSSGPALYERHLMREVWDDIDVTMNFKNTK